MKKEHKEKKRRGIQGKEVCGCEEVVLNMR
jgi:hypothetical protein